MTASFGFPAFNDAMDDDELRGAPVHVYLYLSKRLDFIDFREVKAAVVESEARVKERTVMWALQCLCDRGYIQRGAKSNRVNTYRLIWSLSAEARATKTTKARTA